MCVICVEIIRQRVTPQKGLEGMLEAVRSTTDDETRTHQQDIVDADHAGDEKKVTELIKEGYRRERWL
jgi:hypothetical protein